MKQLFDKMIQAGLLSVLLAACNGTRVFEPPDSGLVTQSENAAGESYPVPGIIKSIEITPIPKMQDPYPAPQGAPPFDDVDEEIPGEHEFSPMPDDQQLGTGIVYIDSTDIYLLESFPVQVELHITGNLPTPCHELRVAVKPPDNQNQIHVKAYSVSDSSQMCIQVLEPIDVQIPLGEFTEGLYTVWLNDDEIGEFEIL